jgi:DNA-directed RNA polymerase II subunit RPB2
MEADSWTILNSFFENDKNFLTKHHIESFNDFVFQKIPNTIKSLNPFVMIKYERNTNKLLHEIKVYIGGKNGDEIYFDKPSISDGRNNHLLFPNEARLKNLTYACNLFANIQVQYISHADNKIHTETFKNIKIGRIPIMLQSRLCSLYNQPKSVFLEMGECVHDVGGYMIIDGKEKVLIAQERIATNRLFINKSRDPMYSYSGMIRCTTEEAAIFPKTLDINVFSKSYRKGARKNAIVFMMPNLKKEAKPDSNNPGKKKPIPICVLFRALGVESDKDILKHIVYDIEDPKNEKIIEFLTDSLKDGAIVFTQQQAFEYLREFLDYNDKHIKTKDEKEVSNLLNNELAFIIMNDLFPNMNETFVNENDQEVTRVSMTKKALFLGHVVYHLVKTCLGMEKETDRDNYLYKRVDISGFLLGNLFRDFYNEFRNECRKQIDREYLYGYLKNKDSQFHTLINNHNRWRIWNSNIIENGFSKSLKGRWGIQQDASKAGIVQDLSRISYIGFSSHLRRVNTPIDRSIKIVDPHRLHASQWGAMCPCESPDGASIGLLKNFAMLCHVTIDCSSKEIVKCLKELGIKFLEYIIPNDVAKSTKVLVNSNWIGITDKPIELVERLRLYRRNALINIMTSISWNVIGKEININTEAGRCCRPLFVVRHNQLLINHEIVEKIRHKKMNWIDLLRGNTIDAKEFNLYSCKYTAPKTLPQFQGKTDEEIISQLKRNQAVVEFIDVEESNTCMIAMSYKNLFDPLKHFTHCEIHPSTIFAVLTANIPFADHNQAPRNYFSGAQGKQAIGIYSTAFNSRMDIMGLVLHYPQRSIVNTRFMHYLHNNEMPNGENAIVAIATYTGYNQEDSIIINKSAIERGMFNLTYFKTIVETEDDNKFSKQKVLFANPLSLINEGKEVVDYGNRFANYHKLDENGLPKLNETIEEGTVYLGKVIKTTEYVVDDDEDNIFKTKIKKETYKDKSLIADKTMYGKIDKVYVFKNSEGLNTCKIRYRKVRLPELGDKHAARHAQKGTIGMIVPHENMPFTKDGIVPDLIINPHAIPTRMTIAQLLECILSKLGCIKGEIYDGTPFCNQDINGAYEQLEKAGYERYANEILYNGITGDQMSTEIFMGPTYYQRLKHMVADKINYRGKGDGGYTTLTRQPLKSRARGGGLRVGEMESAVLLAHGIASFTKESLVYRSDDYKCCIDDSTGDIAIANSAQNWVNSKINPDNKEFSTLNMPYSGKLLLQELQTMAIKPMLVTEKNNAIELEDIETYDDYTFTGFEDDIEGGNDNKNENEDDD